MSLRGVPSAACPQTVCQEAFAFLRPDLEVGQLSLQLPGFFLSLSLSLPPPPHEHSYALLQSSVFTP